MAYIRPVAVVAEAAAVMACASAGVHHVLPAGEIVVVVCVVPTTAPAPFGSEYVTTAKVSLPAGTEIDAVHFVAPPAVVQPGIRGARLIFTGATPDGGMPPFTCMSRTTMDCVAGPVGGRLTENEAVPDVFCRPELIGTAPSELLPPPP